MGRVELRKILAFAAGLFLLNEALVALYGRVVMGGSFLMRAERSFRRERGKAETLFLGDSHGAFDIVPSLIPGAVNFATPGETYIETFYKLKAILADRPAALKRVVLPVDLHEFASLNDDELRQNLYFWIRYVDYVELGRLEGSPWTFTGYWLRGRFLPYAGRGDNILRFFKPRVRAARGGRAREGGRRAGPRDWRPVARNRAREHFRGRRYLDDILLHYFRASVEACRRDGLRVILLKYPVTEQYAAAAATFFPAEALYRVVLDAAGGEGAIEVWDWQKAFFGRNELFRDADHLNRRGAEAFARMLRERLHPERGGP